MSVKQELDKTLLDDLKFKAENPPTKNDEYSKALFSSSILDDLKNIPMGSIK